MEDKAMVIDSQEVVPPENLSQKPEFSQEPVIIDNASMKSDEAEEVKKEPKNGAEPEEKKGSGHEEKKESGYPGPIYNDELILFEPTLKDPGESAKYPLKPGLKEGIDFMLAPNDLWTLWAKVYGGFDLLRHSYTTAEGMKPLVEVYLQRIALLFKSEHKWVPLGQQPLYMGRHEPTSELIHKCQRICGKL